MTNIVYKSSIYIRPVTYPQAQRKTFDFVCSSCWRNLVIWAQEDRDEYLVLCVSCDEDTRGFVHESTVERKKTEDHFNSQEVKKAYPALDPNPREKKSAEDNINDLGF